MQTFSELEPVRPPWTLEQVVNLNDFQNGGGHPFTCVNEHPGGSVLVATPAGWECPSCDYTQDWAWPQMADGSWRQAMDVFVAEASTAGMNPYEWAAWVAHMMDELRRGSDKAETIRLSVQASALRHATFPPKNLLGFVQFQHDVNGKTWPRAWAVAIYLRLAHLYYRRKAHRPTSV